MALLIALPLVAVVWLALHQTFTRTELVEVTTEVPLFGGVTREVTRTVPQPVIGADGRPETTTRFVGAENLREAANLSALRDAAGAASWGRAWAQVMNVDFWSALSFTLLYVATTTPAILALGARRGARRQPHGAAAARIGRVRHPSCPLAITPVVSSLSVYWLFMDRAVVPSTLEWLGLGRHYFLGNAASVRTLIILHGIWYAAPFAFVIYYAGLQTVPRDPVEAAMIDGASAWQRLRYVVVPHLAPLTAIIALVHVMDAYRVFEPILVFGSGRLRELGAVPDLLDADLRGQRQQGRGLRHPHGDRRPRHHGPGPVAVLARPPDGPVRRRRSFWGALGTAGLWTWFVVAVFPFAWMPPDLAQAARGRLRLPAPPAGRPLTFENFHQVWVVDGFWR